MLKLTKTQILNRAETLVERLYDLEKEEFGEEPTLSVIIANILLTSWFLKRLTPRLTPEEKQLITDVLIAIQKSAEEEQLRC